MIPGSLPQTSAGPPPQVVVTAPLSYSVARPMLHLTAKAVAATDSCSLILSKTSYVAGTTYYTVIGTYMDSVDTDLDLSSYEGSSFSLVLQAIDKDSQTSANKIIPVFVESSPYLQEYFSADSKILNFNYNKVLTVDDGPLPQPVITDAGTGTSLPIPFSGLIENGYITPQGAVISANPFTINGFTYDSLYDFNNGSLYSLGTVNQNAVKVAGTYCFWARSNTSQYPYKDSLFLRNLVAGSQTLIAANAPNQVAGLATTGDVTANGSVVYVDSNNNVVKYNNSNYTAITNSAGPYTTRGNINPRTDDHNIAYQYKDLTIVTPMVTGEQGTAKLSDGWRGYPVAMPGTHYQVNNKYVAYIATVFDPSRPSLFSEIRLRDTTGRPLLVLPYEHVTSDQLDLLNPHGDIMFFFNDVRKLAIMNGPVKQICSSLGKTFYRDSSWYIVIGRTVFRLNPNAAPGLISNFSIELPKDSAYKFKTGDFTSHFTGPGQLITLKITGLPNKGILLNAGIPVSLNDQIARIDLYKLSYIPAPGFTGRDTIRWNASDGISYTASEALMTVHIAGRPDRPNLVGLETSYCNNQSIQKIKIANFPGAADAITVQVNLDAIPLMIAATDSSFSLEPTHIPAGPHTIITTFINIAGSAVDSQHFNILEAITPQVKLSADITNITNLVSPVIVTATNVGGGGTNPLYSFAKDRDFVDVLQLPAGNNSLVIASNTFAVGNNRIYVRMTTSEHCYTVQTTMDSIDIRRDPITGIIDADFPGQPITVNPNPFRNRISLRGLNNMKSYIITLYDLSGHAIVSKVVANQVSFDFYAPHAAHGAYLLSIYDEKKKRLLGSARLIKENDD